MFCPILPCPPSSSTSTRPIDLTGGKQIDCGCNQPPINNEGTAFAVPSLFFAKDLCPLVHSSHDDDPATPQEPRPPPSTASPPPPSAVLHVFPRPKRSLSVSRHGARRKQKHRGQNRPRCRIDSFALGGFLDLLHGDHDLGHMLMDVIDIQGRDDELL